MTTLTLYELNSIVRQTLELTLCDEYWICTEISELHVNRHCYMEFVQKDGDSNGLIAKARAQIWANRWSIIKPMFEHTTGQSLSAGMQVLVKVQVTFHEMYGYSLNVTDIDPTYTLGDIAKRRQEILRILREEGVESMNKELHLPRLMQRIAVISSATAAGYSDFCNQLHKNKRGLAFKTELFQATMQGKDVENSVIDALNRIAERLDEWDVVVIIRGGGSTSDLSGFDSLLLAENVAQFPLPIITGIGHERDDTIIDLISHTRVKTPTAAADFIIHHQEEELDNIEYLANAITHGTDKLLLNHSAHLNQLAEKIPMLFSTIKAKEETRIQQFLSILSNKSIQHIENKKNKVQMLNAQLGLVTPMLITKQKHRIELIDSKLTSVDPNRILQLGFSITRIDGKAIRNPNSINEGDVIETTLASGTIKSTVIWKKK